MTPNALILLVDDELDLLELFSMMLNRSGYRTLKAQSGNEAITLLANTTPDLILLDLAMPGMLGVEVLRWLRADDRFADTKVIILTAVPLIIEREDLALAQGLLVKPITPRTLEEAIERVLGA